MKLKVLILTAPYWFVGCAGGAGFGGADRKAAHKTDKPAVEESGGKGGGTVQVGPGTGEDTLDALGRKPQPPKSDEDDGTGVPGKPKDKNKAPKKDSETSDEPESEKPGKESVCIRRLDAIKDSCFDGPLPYAIEVSSEAELLALQRSQTSIAVRLTQDIDLSSSFQPLEMRGTEVVFDGEGHKIRNLRVRGSAAGPAGLFASLSGTGVCVQNLILEGVDVAGGDAVGALVGKLSGTTVSLYNISVSGKIAGASSVGGLVGDSKSTSLTVLDVQADVDVAATGERVGGLIGKGLATRICVQDGRSGGKVAGKASVGGTVGDARSTRGEFDEIKSSVAVSGDSASSGRIAGTLDDSTTLGAAIEATGSLNGDAAGRTIGTVVN